jgi:hypothetical protein
MKCLVVAVAAGLLALPAVASATPAAPTLAGSISNSSPSVVSGSFPGSLSASIGLAVSGNFAYTTAYDPGQLTVLDVSDPTAPAVVAATPATSSMVGTSQVQIFNTTVGGVAGTYAFVVAKNQNASTTSNDNGTGDSLTVVNISTPTNPQVVGVVRDTNALFGAYGVAVSGHYAFVASQGLLGGQPSVPDTSTGSFSVIDLNNLAGGVIKSIDNSSLTGTLANGLNHATAVAIQGNYAYVTAFNTQRLTVIDISTPTSPVVKASLHDSANLSDPNDVVVSGNFAYVDNQSNFNANTNVPQLTVVDISNPLAPTVVGSGVSSPLLNNAYRVRLQGPFAYVSGKNAASLGVVDIANPLLPRLTATYTNTGLLNDVIGVGVDLLPSGAYAIVSSPFLSTQSNHTLPPYPSPTDNSASGNTGTVSAIQLDPTPISIAITPSSEPTTGTTSTSANFIFGPPSDQVYSVQCKLDSGAFGPCSSASSMSYTSLSPGPHTFTVQVTDASGNTFPASWNWTIQGPPQTAPQNTGAPTISGTASVGKHLTASGGTWSGTPTPTLSYQWQRCNQSGAGCNPISGSTGTTYAEQRADMGSTLRVLVTGTNTAGTLSVPSGASGVVTGLPAASGVPTVAGTASVGSTLKGTSPSWTGYPTPTLVYRWARCNKSGASCVTIAGATGTTYKVPSSQLGFTLRFDVSATNSVGNVVVPSKATPVVTAGHSVVRLSLQRASLALPHKGKTSLTVTIKASSSGAKVSALLITLPQGLRLVTSAKALMRSMHVTGAHNAKLSYKSRPKRQSVLITFKHAQSAAVIAISSPALAVLAQFTSKHAKKPKNVVLSLEAVGSRLLTHSQVNLRVKGSG